MSVLSGEVIPKPEESLGRYIQRIREELSLTQAELSEKASVHVQTIRKIESGVTSRLNQKAKSGLSAALNIPQEYLDAVVKQVPVERITTLKFCPKCWTPGTTLDPMWTTVRSKYCFACGSKLRDKCAICNEPILSLKFRFCPYCGESYKLLQGSIQ